MKIALYVRVSKNDGSQTTENQLLDLRQYAARLGHTIVVEYVDNASGKNGDRDRFKDMLEDAKAHKFEALMFWALDRLTREGVLATLQYLETLTKAGVCWISFTESHFDSCGPFKDVVIAMFASLAKMEREKISERTKAGLRRAVSQGKILGRKEQNIDISDVRTRQAKGETLGEIAESMGVNLRTLMRRLAVL
jgi:DNA invertase Pin-like site-specific DNA recombinase